MRNESLEVLSLSGNPLSFECMLNVLDIAKVNRTLKVLNIAGVPMEGPAPIKENPSGLLSKSEGIILILAQTLRQSYLTEVTIDVDVTADVMLSELLNTLTKYNRSLVKLRAPGVNFRGSPRDSVLYGIYRAVLANRWIKRNKSADESRDPELADII